MHRARRLDRVRLRVVDSLGVRCRYDYEALVGCYAPCARLDRVRDPTPSNIVPPEPEPEREPEQEAERKPEPEPENSGMTEPELARSRLFQAQRAAAEAVVAAAAHDGLAQALQTAEVRAALPTACMPAPDRLGLSLRASYLPASSSLPAARLALLCLLRLCWMPRLCALDHHGG